MSKREYLDIETERTELLPISRNDSVNNSSINKRKLGYTALILLAISTCFVMLFGPVALTPVVLLGSIPSTMRSSSTGGFDAFGRYVMQDYDIAKPMSDFLAGIGGKWGIPAWAFFVNRGQGIASFGIKDKNGGIMKFDTAEKVYLNVATQGFRTMLRGQRKGFMGATTSQFTHQPFATRGVEGNNENLVRDMAIGMNEMEIEEVDTDLALKTNILYYTIPNEKFPGMIRKTTFTNLGSTDLSLDILDGISRVIPVGPDLTQIDTMGRTIEAYYRIYNLEDSRYTVPFYHLSQQTGDTASVQVINNGVFAVSFVEGEEDNLLKFVVDPTVVFADDTTTLNPKGFFGTGSTPAPTYDDFTTQVQASVCRTPSAFAATQALIQPKESFSIYSVYGQAPDQETLNEYIKDITTPGYVSKKRDSAEVLAKSITTGVNTSTSQPIFDMYVQMDYLDNVLRGGLPMKLGKKNPKIYHIFNRVHGDLERDYNNFIIEPVYFSQGPGNFRDVNQNRRVDVSITPYIKDFNIRTFLSLVQLDGYNPLSVASTLFKMDKSGAKQVMALLEIPKGLDETITNILTAPFRPGNLIQSLYDQGVNLPEDRDGFIDTVVDVSVQDNAGAYGQNGFWADHWSYTLDLADNYLSIYPDELKWLLYHTEPIPSFAAPAVVRSRKYRYSLVPNPDSDSQPPISTISSPAAVSMWDDPDFPGDRQDLINYIKSSDDYMADEGQAGNTWHLNKDGTTAAFSVISKFAMLGIIKFSTLDPLGMGVEYEGGKPGWNDAMNGLPGLLGSGMPETYEMIRILEFVKKGCDSVGKAVEFPEEFTTFLTTQMKVLEVYETSNTGSETDHFKFWDDSNTAREKYRKSIDGFLTGKTVKVEASELSVMITRMLKFSYAGVKDAVAIGNGLSPTYFRYECTEYEQTPPVDVVDPPLPDTIEAKAFKLHSLPYFLEGPTRHLKLVHEYEDQKKVYDLVKASGMYDKELSMLMVCESLDSMGQSVGRMKAFSPGWLENQSIWLHMSYKFYLELIRGGLYNEFYEEIKTGLVPFMDTDVYGRSPLEAASFLVSSVFPDTRIHGQGYLARLSGSTAEFMSIWLAMFSGLNPYTTNSDGDLVLKFTPALKGFMFKEDGTAMFTFLGNVIITYHNPTLADSWTINVTGYTVNYTDGRVVKLNSESIVGDVALDIRQGKVASVDVYY